MSNVFGCFLTKSRNVYISFLTKTRNVYERFLTKIRNVLFFKRKENSRKKLDES